MSSKISHEFLFTIKASESNDLPKPFTRILYAIRELQEAKKDIDIDHVIVLESIGSNEDSNWVVKFDLKMTGDGLLRHYFFGQSRGSRIFLKNNLVILGRTVTNCDTVLMKFHPGKW